MTSSQHEADQDQATIDAYWADQLAKHRAGLLREDTFAYKPARDLRAGDIMWDAAGAYRISKVQREAGVVSFDVEATDEPFTARWELGADDQVRVYV